MGKPSGSKSSGRLTRLVIALSISIGLQVILSSLFAFSNPETSPMLYRISVLLGGNLATGGYIQFFTFFSFFWGLLEVRFFSNWIQFEQKYFNVDLLPGDEHVVLNAAEINRIRLKVVNYLESKRHENPDAHYYLLQLVKKACTKFRANHSAEAAFMIVESQSRINREKSESSQSGIRYLLWAIPSIGFVGTILGISNALGLASSGDIDLITSTLGVAFDTTLVALVLSLILMYVFHDLQERTENLHHNIEEFVVENLINKIDVS
jgi:biopolymer transport protein ExbB/TolQ